MRLFPLHITLFFVHLGTAVHAIKYPSNPVINEEVHTFFLYVNNIYLEMPLVYSDSTKSENYVVVTEVWVSSGAWKIIIPSFTNIICQNFPHPTFPCSMQFSGKGFLFIFCPFRARNFSLFGLRAFIVTS